MASTRRRKGDTATAKNRGASVRLPYAAPLTDIRERWSILQYNNPKKTFPGNAYRRLLAHRIFMTRHACQEYIDKEWGWLRERPDLREYPHGWCMPKPVRVTVTTREN